MKLKLAIMTSCLSVALSGCMSRGLDFPTSASTQSDPCAMARSSAMLGPTVTGGIAESISNANRAYDECRRKQPHTATPAEIRMAATPPAVTAVISSGDLISSEPGLNEHVCHYLDNTTGKRYDLHTDQLCPQHFP